MNLPHFSIPPLLALRQLLAPSDATKYERSEGNVESLFASRLLTDVVAIPQEWLYHQYSIQGGRADIAVVINGTVVLIVECKKAAEFTQKAKNSVKLREPLNQGLGYAFTSGAPLVLVTDGRHLSLVDSQTLVIAASTPEEILTNGADLLNALRPNRLYYLSRKFQLPTWSSNAVRILGRAYQLDLSGDVAAAAESVRHEFYDENRWRAFRDELLSWQSLAQHLARSVRLRSARQNQVVHIDHSFVSYFQGAWYYDQLHREVIQREGELVRKMPGTALRVFVLKDREQLVRELLGLRGLLHQQLSVGYRCGILYNSDWMAAGLGSSHLDVVGGTFAKIYNEVEGVLTGEVVNSPRHVTSFRDAAIDIVKEYGRIFEPLAHRPTTLSEVDEFLRAEAEVGSQTASRALHDAGNLRGSRRGQA